MELTIYDIEGKDTGRKVVLSEDVFGIEKPSDHAIYQDVRLIQANQRQGTHKAKERNEVSGSKKKPFRQKGTGNARQGHKRSPLHRHGGRVFGPHPRDYGFRLNKKLRQLARKSALTYKAKESNIRVIEDFSFEAPKTKQFLNILQNLSVDGKKTLMILGNYDPIIYRSCRNLPKAHVMPAIDINTYDILHAETLILTENAVGIINERMGQAI